MGQMEGTRERGMADGGEGEGLYRYIPAAVVCNIMITLPGCLAASPLPSSPSYAAQAARPPSFSGHVAGKYDYCYYLHPPSTASS